MEWQYFSVECWNNESLPFFGTMRTWIRTGKYKFQVLRTMLGAFAAQWCRNLHLPQCDAHRKREKASRLTDFTGIRKWHFDNPTRENKCFLWSKMNGSFRKVLLVCEKNTDPKHEQFFGTRRSSMSCKLELLWESTMHASLKWSYYPLLMISPFIQPRISKEWSGRASDLYLCLILSRDPSSSR